MFEIPALTRFERQKSIRRYLPPKGTDAIERFFVRRSIVSSWAFAKTIPATLDEMSSIVAYYYPTNAQEHVTIFPIVMPTSSYAYVGTRNSSAKESGAVASVPSHTAAPHQPDTPLQQHNGVLELTSSNPCVVMTAKDYRWFCDTFVYQAKIEYAQ